MSARPPSVRALKLLAGQVRNYAPQSSARCPCATSAANTGDANANPSAPTRRGRCELVAHLRGEGHSYRAIGKKLAVDHKTAMNDAATREDSPVQPTRIVGLDGKSCPATR